MAYKILIVGAGSIGTRHLKNLLKLGYKDIAVCDPDPKKLKAVSELGNFMLFKNLKTAMETRHSAVVFICNPTHLHVSTASLVLDYNVHVFIEKPLSHSLKGVDALIKKAKKKKAVVMVACNWRFHEGFKKLKQILDFGKFGKPVLAYAAGGYYLPTARKNTNYRKIYAAGTKGGGVVLDSGAHALDYMENFFGPAKNITAIKRKAHILDIKNEEAAIIALEHKSGVVSAVIADYVSKKSTGIIRVVTSEGILDFNISGNTIFFKGAKGEKKILHHGKYDINQMFVEELKHFFKCVKTRSKPAQDLTMAKHVLKTLLLSSKSKAQKA